MKLSAMQKATLFTKKSIIKWLWCPVSGILAITMVIGSPPLMAATQEDLAPGRKMAQQATQSKKRWITTDHAKHEILKQEFTSGPEVTQACLSCHTEAAIQFHKTIHWTWMDPATTGGKKLGKGGLSVNNF